MERFSLLNMAEDLSRAVVLVSADAKQEKREHQRAEDCQDEPDEGKVADAFQHQGDQGHANRGAKAVAKLDATVILAVTFFAKEGVGEPGQADRSHRNANAEEEDHQDQEWGEFDQDQQKQTGDHGQPSK